MAPDEDVTNALHDHKLQPHLRSHLRQSASLNNLSPRKSLPTRLSRSSASLRSQAQAHAHGQAGRETPLWERVKEPCHEQVVKVQEENAPIGLRCEEVDSAKAPDPITTSPPLKNPPTEEPSALRELTLGIAEAEPKLEGEAEPEANLETKTEPEVETEPEAEIEIEALGEPVGEVEPEVEAEPEGVASISGQNEVRESLSPTIQGERRHSVLTCTKVTSTEDSIATSDSRDGETACYTGLEIDSEPELGTGSRATTLQGSNPSAPQTPVEGENSASDSESVGSGSMRWGKRSKKGDTTGNGERMILKERGATSEHGTPTKIDRIPVGSDISRSPISGGGGCHEPNNPEQCSQQGQPDFSPLTTDIPTEEFLEEELLDSMSFSKRGSIMFGGKKADQARLRVNGRRRQPSISMLATPTIRVLPADIEMESQKVRSMYEQGASPYWEDGQYVSMNESMNSEEHPDLTNGLLSPGSSDRPASEISMRQEHELAGGIEDWEDVNGRDVDRYGFINKRDNGKSGNSEIRTPQRVSTILHMASETPRKRRGFGRSPSNATSAAGRPRTQGRNASAQSMYTQTSDVSPRNGSRVRALANHFPGNQDRKCVDEAGDMLTLPPGLADIAEDEEGGRAVELLKKKEWERAEKWRKMAKVVKRGKDGEGMEFEFDARNPKLIERTWKGIPDRWRSAAWYSFLESSAKKRKDSPSEKDIITAFHVLLGNSSADDQQIDTDVPRTINSHIMFRKRYRGGQRLLFRVLHCLSLYFPDTGYVQGMASLAATLLCYYDEEKTFVMLVRMWTLRGLKELYASGFDGLMAALEEFHKKWMRGRPVVKKLDELSIEPTSYGTRWYLTLFNYSIPFPAQLRVWDVFMLLGDADPVHPPLPSPQSTMADPVTGAETAKVDFRGGLDVLHATSAALIDGTREILLDSDFENAMKVLTSWIPVKDEELLMKVAKAEWKSGRGRGRR